MNLSTMKVTTALLGAILGFASFQSVFAGEDFLAAVDAKLVYKNFPLKNAAGIVEAEDHGSRILGCPQIKSFTIYEGNYPTQIVIALCTSGKYGPKSIESTIEKNVDEAKKSASKMGEEFSTLLLSGILGLSIDLNGGRSGRALTIPMFGHGMALVPMAYRVDDKKGNAIFVQVFADQQEARDLNASSGTLLKAVDESLQ